MEESIKKLQKTPELEKCDFKRIAEWMCLQAGKEQNLLCSTSSSPMWPLRDQQTLRNTHTHMLDAVHAICVI